ncbi:hypothetical protein MTO96_046429 [Rhipicephalus appendiculatus]
MPQSMTKWHCTRRYCRQPRFRSSGRCKRGVGSAPIYSDQSRSPVLLSTSDLLERGSLTDVIWRPGPRVFTREQVVVGCLYYVINNESSGKKTSGTQSICDEGHNVYLRLLLTLKNVSLIYADHANTNYAISSAIGGQADLLLSPTSLDDIMVDVFSFADTDIHYDTFYALANDNPFRLGVCNPVLLHLGCSFDSAVLAHVHSPFDLVELSRHLQGFLRECHSGSFLLIGITSGHLDTRTFASQTPLDTAGCLRLLDGYYTVTLGLHSQSDDSIGHNYKTCRSSGHHRRVGKGRGCWTRYPSGGGRHVEFHQLEKRSRPLFFAAKKTQCNLQTAPGRTASRTNAGRLYSIRWTSQQGLLFSCASALRRPGVGPRNTAVPGTHDNDA